jgi:hypothetical protein
MLEWIVNTIICDEYQKEFKDKGEHKYAMKLEFSLAIDYEKEEGYRNVELWLYAEDNYVGVYSRENWNVAPLNSNYDENGDPKYESGVSEWQSLSFHDSCWRTDGIDRFIFKHKDRIICLRSLHGWYEKVPMTKEMIKTFREVLRKKRGY